MKRYRKILGVHSLYVIILALGSIFLLNSLTLDSSKQLFTVFRIILLLGGSILLTRGAQKTVKHTLILIKSIPYSPGILGVTLFAFISAFPDLILSLGLTHIGGAEIGTYVIVGSNIATILLIGGIAARIAYIKYDNNKLIGEISIAIASTGLLFVLLISSLKATGTISINRIHGIILIFCGAITGLLISKSSIQYAKSFLKETQSHRQNTWGLIAGLISILAGTSSILYVAIEAIQSTLLPSHLLGGGLLALCISLPELALVYFSSRNSNESLALGTVVGSNSINIFFVLGTIGLLTPFTLSENLLWDIGFLAVCQLLLFVTIKFNKHHTLYHFTGMLLMGLYICYLFFLIQK